MVVAHSKASAVHKTQDYENVVYQINQMMANKQSKSKGQT